MQTPTATAARFAVQELPYAYDALAPQFSEETLHYHHDKHYAGYVSKLNELVVDTPYAGQPLEDIVLSSDGAVYNNAAQAWNHEFYFGQLSPRPQSEPQDALLEAIDHNFGSFDRMKNQMTTAAVGLFGSGWVWLAAGPADQLVILSMPNAGNPLREGYRPLLCIDVWEHAYYVDFRNRRADAVAALWERLDWKTVGERYERK
ncbi:MAG: superoxide dismutase [Alistipes sp.]|nr:superoxide dismutase [Alistipes senegalensis]MCM1251044.1 superoxide dismutase [Alistipes sp.]